MTRSHRRLVSSRRSSRSILCSKLKEDGLVCVILGSRLDCNICWCSVTQGEFPEWVLCSSRFACQADGLVLCIVKPVEFLLTGIVQEDAWLVIQNLLFVISMKANRRISAVVVNHSDVAGSLDWVAQGGSLVHWKRARSEFPLSLGFIEGQDA